MLPGLARVKRKNRTLCEFQNGLDIRCLQPDGRPSVCRLSIALPSDTPRTSDGQSGGCSRAASTLRAVRPAGPSVIPHVSSGRALLAGGALERRGRDRDLPQRQLTYAANAPENRWVDDLTINFPRFVRKCGSTSS